MMTISKQFWQLHSGCLFFLLQYYSMSHTIAYTDTTVLTFGMHKNKALANIPAAYLLYLYDNNKTSDAGLKKYIENNMEVLRKEVARLPKNWNR